MKIKKFLSALTAVCLCVTSAVTFTACDEEDVPKDIIPPTHQHNYGEWKILKMPSEYGAGVAEKVCAEDEARDHVITANLPAFTRAGRAEYESYSAENHIVSFTYKHDSGDITATTVANIEDAIALGMENKSKVVGGNIELYHDYKIYEAQARGEIFYEFGDNYTHVSDRVANNRDTFYELNEDGSMFAVGLEWKSLVELENPGSDASASIVHDYQEVLKDGGVTPDMLEGFGFNFIWLDGDERSYGVENFINFIYNNYYEINLNEDRAASIETLNDGTLSFNFSVSVLNELTTQNFHMIEVSFTLDENYVVKTADIRNRTWINPDRDDSGKYVAPDEDYKVMDQYSVVQQTEREEGASVPVNPYVYDDMLLTAYDLVYNGKTLTDGEEIEVDADCNIIINLENILPGTYNLYFDEITATLTDESGEVKECVSTAIDLTDGDIMTMVTRRVSYDGEAEKVVIEPDLYIKSLLAGKFTLTLKSANLTKTVKLAVNKIAPSYFGANVYEYNAVKQSWSIDNFNTEFTVYAGQALNFTSYVLHPFYEEADFTVADGNNFTVTDNEVEGVNVKKFVATEAGDYTVTLVNNKDSEKTVTLTVHVLAAPEMSELLNGEYFNVESSVYLTFVPASEGATTGTATVIWDKDKKTQSETVYTYGYNGETGVTLTATSGESRDATLELDDAYNMYLVYKGKFDKTIRINLYNEVPNLIEGTYRITNASSNALRLSVNIEGTYKLEADSYTTVYYAIYDEATDRQLTENVRVTDVTEVNLEVGQFIKVWSIGAPLGEPGEPVGEPATQYTLTFVPEVSEPEAPEAE